MKNGEIPFSEDAERGLICSVLLGGDAIAVELSVPKSAFYIPANQLVWETVNDLLVEHRPLAFPVLKNRLDRLDQLEEVGGVQYLDELYTFVPTCANFRHYSELVLDYWRIRNALMTTKVLQTKLEGRGRATWAELRSDVESALVALINDGSEEQEPSTKQITMAWHEELCTRKERLARDGIGFGVEGLDRALGMQQPGELVIIGAATSTGKSMLAYQGVVHNAGERKLPVGLISLEMTASQTWDRLASHSEKIWMDRFRDGDFRPEDSPKLCRFSAKMCDEMRFHFCGRRLDIDGIKSWARRAKARHDIRLLVVDYLQRVGVPPRLQKAPRQEQVSYVSSELKSLALELSMVIWCPVQLNKEGDVRESAAIEFDADISIQIVLDEDAKENGAIVFNKVRQAARAKNLPIRMKGWVQTIEERKEEVGHGEAI